MYNSEYWDAPNDDEPLLDKTDDEPTDPSQLGDILHDIHLGGANDDGGSQSEEERSEVAPAASASSMTPSPVQEDVPEMHDAPLERLRTATSTQTQTASQPQSQSQSQPPTSQELGNGEAARDVVSTPPTFLFRGAYSDIRL